MKVALFGLCLMGALLPTTMASAVDSFYVQLRKKFDVANATFDFNKLPTTETAASFNCLYVSANSPNSYDHKPFTADIEVLDGGDIFESRTKVTISTVLNNWSLYSEEIGQREYSDKGGADYIVVRQAANGDSLYMEHREITKTECSGHDDDFECETNTYTYDHLGICRPL